MALFRNAGLSRLWFKEHKLTIFQSQKFLQQEMPTLREEQKPVVLVESGLENREKLKLKAFLWNFWTIRNLMRGIKP